ncbi:hypothetical protein B0H19DRAFT_1165802 [Mycena capillaripes]|nr:hypothetical protein B0H19DRAFT_1165802 [Mycena capillaripes]
MRSLLLLPVAAARILHALPDDPASFPKYKLDFLDHRPLAKHTAQRWLAHGLRGGVREFLEDDSWHAPALGTGDDQQVTFAVAEEDVSLAPTPDAANDYALEHLKMGPDEYLCLIPKPLEPPPPDSEPEDEPTPAHSWSLLLPLNDTCLYLRQGGWFTYSYCHNHEIRQFRELIQAQPPPAGPRHPEEDHTYESYTLGRAPQAPEPGADLTVAQQDALAANLELARSAGSRYLVQRWGDGTICDKTGKPREVEVQFHCSMVTTDAIAFVKETRTCAYILVVHTPRLCGEPGFMKKDTREQASISCREVVAGELPDRSDAAFLPGADHPLKFPRRKPVLPLPPPPAADTAAEDGKLTSKLTTDFLKMFGNIKELQIEDVEMIEDDDGSIFIEFFDDDLADVEGAAAERLAHLLREAGIDIKGAASSSKTPKKKKNGDEKQDANDVADRRREVDEIL